MASCVTSRARKAEGLEIQAPWGLIEWRRKPFHGLATRNRNSHSGIKSRRFSGVMTTESGCSPSGRSRPM